MRSHKAHYLRHLSIQIENIAIWWFILEKVIYLLNLSI